jgi:hypothetical protein
MQAVRKLGWIFMPVVFLANSLGSITHGIPFRSRSASLASFPHFNGVVLWRSIFDILRLYFDYDPDTTVYESELMISSFELASSFIARFISSRA